MKRKKVCYLSECESQKTIKTGLIIITSVCFGVPLILWVTGVISFLEVFYFTPLFFIPLICKFKLKQDDSEYKQAMVRRNNSITNGKKSIGKIVKTEIETHTVEVYTKYAAKDVIVYEYYAVVEFKDENGETVRFRTDELNLNPEYITNKEVTIHTFNGEHYVSEFGYAEIPKPKIDNIFSMNSMR